VQKVGKKIKEQKAFKLVMESVFFTWLIKNKECLASTHFII
jgi:hypothetical protein